MTDVLLWATYRFLVKVDNVELFSCLLCYSVVEGYDRKPHRERCKGLEVTI